MTGYRVPNICLSEENHQTDAGTMCLARNSPPGTLDGQTCDIHDMDDLRHVTQLLEAEAAVFAKRFIQDASVRKEYMRLTKEFADDLLRAVDSGKMPAKRAAELGHSMRNSLLESARLKSSDIGRAIAESIKSTGLTLAQLQEKYALKQFGKAFDKLADAQKSQVYREIVKASGRARPSVSRSAARWGKAGRGLVVLSVGLVAYDIYTAENKPKAAATGGASIGGGMLGGAAGGAAAGLVCGPGAPICSGVGILVGGGLGALGASSLVDWLWD